MSSLTTYIWHIRNPTYSNHVRKVYRRHLNSKGKGKAVTLCRWCDDSLYREPWSLPPQTIKLIDEFSKLTGYKIKTQKYVTFFTIIIKYQKDKLNKQSHLKLYQK